MIENAQNEVVASVIGMMNALDLYATVTRGALTIGNSISCEVAPSAVSNNFLNKESIVPLSLVLNAKHHNLETATKAMNLIHARLTRMTEYTSGTGWEIVDIRNSTLPQVIGREENNDWLLASRLTVLYYWKGE